MKFIFTLLILMLSFDLVMVQTVDFLIVENPKELNIYNKYQQHISNQTRDKFVHFTPFQIIEKNEQLTDQITLASRVLFNHHVMFIIKNEEGQYISHENEYIRLFKNCEIYGDTIRILKNLRVYIFKKPEHLSQKNKHIYLPAGQECIRIFKYKNLDYLKLLTDSTIYGWTKLPRSGWEINRPSDTNISSIPDNLISKLLLRIETANQDYKNIFGYFNKKYNRNIIIPSWNLDVSEREIRGNLKKPSLIVQLKNSNRYLMQDIDNIFLGSGYTLNFSDSTFVIKFSKD